MVSVSPHVVGNGNVRLGSVHSVADWSGKVSPLVESRSLRVRDVRPLLRALAGRARLLKKASHESRVVTVDKNMDGPMSLYAHDVEKVADVCMKGMQPRAFMATAQNVLFCCFAACHSHVANAVYRKYCDLVNDEGSHLSTLRDVRRSTMAVVTTYLHMLVRHGSPAAVLNVWNEWFGSQLVDAVQHDAAVTCGSNQGDVGRLQPDIGACNVLLLAFAKHGDANDVVLILDKMNQNNIVKNARTYDIVLPSVVREKHWRELTMLVNAMQREGIKPTVSTVASLVKGFQYAGMFGKLDELLEHPSTVDENLFVTFVAAYGKSGCSAAKLSKVIERLSSLFPQKKWTGRMFGSVISGYGRLGDVERMEDVWLSFSGGRSDRHSIKGIAPSEAENRESAATPHVQLPVRTARLHGYVMSGLVHGAAVAYGDIDSYVRCVYPRERDSAGTASVLATPRVIDDHRLVAVLCRYFALSHRWDDLTHLWDHYSSSALGDAVRKSDGVSVGKGQSRSTSACLEAFVGAYRYMNIFPVHGPSTSRDGHASKSVSAFLDAVNDRAIIEYALPDNSVCASLLRLAAEVGGDHIVDSLVGHLCSGRQRLSRHTLSAVMAAAGASCNTSVMRWCVSRTTDDWARLFADASYFAALCEASVASGDKGQLLLLWTKLGPLRGACRAMLENGAVNQLTKDIAQKDSVGQVWYDAWRDVVGAMRLGGHMGVPQEAPHANLVGLARSSAPCSTPAHIGLNRIIHGKNHATVTDEHQSGEERVAGAICVMSDVFCGAFARFHMVQEARAAAQVCDELAASLRFRVKDLPRGQHTRPHVQMEHEYPLGAETLVYLQRMYAAMNDERGLQWVVSRARAHDLYRHGVNSDIQVSPVVRELEAAMETN